MDRDRVLTAHGRLLRSWLDETLVRCRLYGLAPRWDVLAAALYLLGPGGIRTRLEIDPLVLDLVVVAHEQAVGGQAASGRVGCCEYARASVPAILACLASLDRRAVPLARLERVSAWLGGAVAAHVRHLERGDRDREEATSLAEALASLRGLPVPSATRAEVSGAVGALATGATEGAGLTRRPLLALMVATAWFDGEICRPDLRSETRLRRVRRTVVPDRVSRPSAAVASAHSGWTWSSPRNYGGLRDRIISLPDRV